MDNLKATKRSISSHGKTNQLRADGLVPAVLYGGTKDNMNISLKKFLIEDIIKSDSFMSTVLNLDIDGSSEKVLPKDIAYDPVSDEPIHIDFMRIVEGAKLFLEIPVKFINNDKSPGLKKGGVLNIVRRKVELKCPAEEIPQEIIVDLENTEIGKSLKISTVKLPKNVSPTITDRDFVIATIASPTIIVEPEKPAEETPEGTEAAAEGATEGTAEGEVKQEDGKEKSAKSTEDKTKSEEKDKDKGQSSGKDKETKKK